MLLPPLWSIVGSYISAQQKIYLKISICNRHHSPSADYLKEEEFINNLNFICESECCEIEVVTYPPQNEEERMYKDIKMERYLNYFANRVVKHLSLVILTALGGYRDLTITMGQLLEKIKSFKDLIKLSLNTDPLSHEDSILLASAIEGFTKLEILYLPCITSSNILAFAKSLSMTKNLICLKIGHWCNNSSWFSRMTREIFKLNPEALNKLEHLSFYHCKIFYTGDISENIDALKLWITKCSKLRIIDLGSNSMHRVKLEQIKSIFPISLLKSRPLSRLDLSFNYNVEDRRVISQYFSTFPDLELIIRNF